MPFLILGARIASATLVAGKSMALIQMSTDWEGRLWSLDFENESATTNGQYCLTMRPCVVGPAAGTVMTAYNTGVRQDIIAPGLLTLAIHSLSTEPTSVSAGIPLAGPSLGGIHWRAQSRERTIYIDKDGTNGLAIELTTAPAPLFNAVIRMELEVG